MMPALMRERLDEFGIDYAIVYPTSGLGLPQVPDETERRADALDDVNPAQFDDEGLLSYAHQYVPGEFADEMQQRARRGNAISHMQPPAEGLDEFSACGFTDSESLVRQFVDGFYFGCEADDPINAWAFKREHLPHQVQLKTLFGSDIGHFDVQDMAGVVPEAYELVERDLITSGDFRSFVFSNAVEFLSTNNRAFFEGTLLEQAVSAR